jgi:hypothetical protein
MPLAGLHDRADPFVRQMDARRRIRFHDAAEEALADDLQMEHAQGSASRG